jgi:hypothetical protein
MLGVLVKLLVRQSGGFGDVRRSSAGIARLRVRGGRFGGVREDSLSNRRGGMKTLAAG